MGRDAESPVFVPLDDPLKLDAESAPEDDVVPVTSRPVEEIRAIEALVNLVGPTMRLIFVDDQMYES